MNSIQIYCGDISTICDQIKPGFDYLSEKAFTLCHRQTTFAKHSRYSPIRKAFWGNKWGSKWGSKNRTGFYRKDPGPPCPADFQGFRYPAKNPGTSDPKTQGKRKDWIQGQSENGWLLGAMILPRLWGMGRAKSFNEITRWMNKTYLPV